MTESVINHIRIFYSLYIFSISLFMIWFIRRVTTSPSVPTSSLTVKSETPLEKKFFLGVILAVIFGHIVTLSNFVPWQEWRIWSAPKIEHQVQASIEKYNFNFKQSSIVIKQGQYVQFEIESKDVTYGFGVFDQKGLMHFQFSVLPGRKNTYVWKFDKAGYYDVRSTEYSGADHSKMHIKNIIQIVNEEEV